MITLTAITGLLFGFFLGRRSIRTVTITDFLKVKSYRSETQTKQDAVMQLKNKIATSGAVKFEETENGYNVKITVVK
jgi:hypothetical protein